MARRSAGTGARTPTGTPPGARPAAPCRSGPAPAQPPWRPSAGTATTTDGPSPTGGGKGVRCRVTVGAAGPAAPGGGEHGRARGQAREVGPAPGPGRDLLPGPRRIAWRALPADFPPHQTVYALFRRWTRARARPAGALGD